MTAPLKRRLTYIDLAGVPVEGKSARVLIKGQGWFHTTAVIEILPHFDGPVFETRNSIYWPGGTDGSPLNPFYNYSEKRDAKNPTAIPPASRVPPQPRTAS